MSFNSIPKTVLFGRVSHWKSQHNILHTAMQELVDAADTRKNLASDADPALKIVAQQRVIRAYARCRELTRTTAPVSRSRLRPLPAQLNLL